MSAHARYNPIDDLMEKASRALADTNYFDAIIQCEKALKKARRANDFEKLSRITLPLLEARRQVRQIATDTAPSVHYILDPNEVGDGFKPGCYMVAPPLIGLDARTIHEMGLRKNRPVLAIAREPLTRDGRWPVVAVSEVSVRIRIAPPEPVDRVETNMRKDEFAGDIPVKWFENTYEALGDQAIKTVDPAEPAAYRVDDLIERINALPYHEKLHQALHAAAREAMTEPLPDLPRRRPQLRPTDSF